MLQQNIEVSAFMPRCDPEAQSFHPLCQNTSYYRRCLGKGKCSYQRAFCRALRDGTAPYKGRNHTFQGLGGREHASASVPQSACQDAIPMPSKPKPTSRKKPGQKQRSPRLKVLSWNSGGLPTPRLDMLLLCMVETQFQVLCVQEARWRFTSEWLVCVLGVQLACIHSGAEALCFLCALNTWPEPFPNYSLIGPNDAGSLIDLILIRQSMLMMTLRSAMLSMTDVWMVIAIQFGIIFLSLHPSFSNLGHSAPPSLLLLVRLMLTHCVRRHPLRVHLPCGLPSAFGLYKLNFTGPPMMLLLIYLMALSVVFS